MRKRLIILIFVALFLLLGYEGLTYIDNYAQPGRMRETPAVRPHEKGERFFEDGLVPFGGAEALLKLARGEDLRLPFESTSRRDIELGKDLYFTYCAQCHGKDLDGNGTVGQSFYPLPTDLQSQRIQALPEGLIFKEISYGTRKPGNRQPPLASTIAISDRWRIVAYVKTVGPRR